MEVLAVSADLLLEPPRDTLCRFLEEASLSSKGFGRVEQGSEEAARSRDNSAGSWSIGQVNGGGQRVRRGSRNSGSSAEESLKAS